MLSKREIIKGISAKLTTMGSAALEGKYLPGQEVEVYPVKHFIDGINGVAGEFKDIYIKDTFIATLHYFCWKEV